MSFLRTAADRLGRVPFCISAAGGKDGNNVDSIAADENKAIDKLNRKGASVFSVYGYMPRKTGE